MISQLWRVESASSGIFIWQDTVSSEFSFIVFPTILHRLWSLMLVEPWARYTILFCKLNLTFVSFEEELQAVPTTDTISPAKNRSLITFFLKKCTRRWIKISRIAHIKMTSTLRCATLKPDCVYLGCKLFCQQRQIT